VLRSIRVGKQFVLCILRRQGSFKRARKGSLEISWINIHSLKLPKLLPFLASDGLLVSAYLSMLRFLLSRSDDSGNFRMVDSLYLFSKRPNLHYASKVLYFLCDQSRKLLHILCCLIFSEWLIFCTSFLLQMCFLRKIELLWYRICYFWSFCVFLVSYEMYWKWNHFSVSFLNM
jgi:hypothetical protein